jgi:formylglycine-generating enzyme required for sulfatase activity
MISRRFGRSLFGSWHSVLAMALLAVVSYEAMGDVIVPDMVHVGNRGNAAYTGNPLFPGPSGVGAVNHYYLIGKTEVTNSEYAAFLNAIGQQNANSGTFGGIIQSGTSGAFTYTVSSGFENKPVNWVTWFSAARYVNWLENGQPVDASGAAVNTGAYNLGTATSGNIAIRTPGSTWYLPSVSEWFKAAFYNPTTASYSTYGTGMNTVTSGTGGAASDGVVYQVSSSGPQPVGSFPNADSYYGLYDASGNVREWTGKINPTSSATNRQEAYLANGSYAGGTDFSVSIDNGVYALGTSASAGIGFRVAAVPEPSAMALAAAGLAGVAGWRRLQRRRSGAGA